MIPTQKAAAVSSCIFSLLPLISSYYDITKITSINYLLVTSFTGILYPQFLPHFTHHILFLKNKQTCQRQKTDSCT